MVFPESVVTSASTGKKNCHLLLAHADPVVELISYFKRSASFSESALYMSTTRDDDGMVPAGQTTWEAHRLSRKQEAHERDQS